MPGELIREELLSRGWSQSDLADVIKKPLPSVNRIIKGTKAITPETAIALARAFGTSPDYWMVKEAGYRLSLAERDSGAVETRARVYDVAPLGEMVKRRWIDKPKSPEDAESSLCRFLEIADLDDPPKLLVNARSSLPDNRISGEQIVWCYRAYHLSKLQKVARFRRSRIPELKEHLRNLSYLAAGVSEVPKLLNEFGIRFVVVQHLAKTKIDGAAFWLGSNSPVVALSSRYDRVNYFWHTLAHEISHVYHNDADIDEDSFSTKRSELDEAEARADREAAETFVPINEMRSFISRVSPIYTISKIVSFANRLRIHPSIVLGQLQHLGELDWSKGVKLQSKYRHILSQTALVDGWGQFLPV